MRVAYGGSNRRCSYIVQSVGQPWGMCKNENKPLVQYEQAYQAHHRMVATAPPSPPPLAGTTPHSGIGARQSYWEGGSTSESEDSHDDSYA